MNPEQFARELLELEKKADDVEPSHRVFLLFAAALRVCDAHAKRVHGPELSAKRWKRLAGLARELVRYGLTVEVETDAESTDAE